MKRLVSLTVSFLLTISCLSVSFSVFAEGLEKDRLETFAEKCVEVVNEYDEGKVFELVDESTPEEDDLQFQTARLFVKCSSYFNKMGAEEKVSGFDAWHLLQFSSPEEAKKAYNYYLNQKDIECVEPDAPTKVELDASGDDVQYMTKEEFLNDYSRQVMGFDQVLPYINNNSIQTTELKVAVLDTGVDYNHEIFEGRLFRTYFNATTIGAENDEYDIEVAGGHGTSTTSCIVANTPDTIKVGCYKALDNNKHTEDPELVPSRVVAALLQAYSDGCIAINMSFTVLVKIEVFNDALKTLNNSGVALFASAGNESAHDTYGRKHTMLCTNKYVYAVGGSNNQNAFYRNSNSGPWVRFIAPYKDVCVAVPNNNYLALSGTSLSSPLAVAEFALLKSLNNDYSNEKLIDLMTYSCQTPRNTVDSTYVNNTSWSGTLWYGGGILDAVGAFCELMSIDRAEKVSFSLESGGMYHKGDEVILSAESGSTIYYTINSTFPLKNEWIEYTNPIQIDNFTEINAIAVSDKSFISQNSYAYFLGFDVGTDDMFTITEDGVITSYTGDYTFLEIPEKIQGINVNSLKGDLFAKGTEGLIAIKLPDSVEYIEKPSGGGLFFNHETIEFFYAKNLKRINYATFQKCTHLLECYIPNVEYICSYAFEGDQSLEVLSCPKVEHIERRAFQNIVILNLDLPNLKSFDEYLFGGSSKLEVLTVNNLEKGIETFYSGDVAWLFYNTNPAFLENLFLPNITTICDGDFHNLQSGRIEFSKLKELYSLPVASTLSGDTNTCILVLPSTLKTIDPFGPLNQKYLAKNKLTRIFYGTRGSYAEQWANENGFEFIELNQDSAIVTDVRENCNKYTRTLFFDSMGFNKEYQWYGSYDNSTDKGIELVGATKELLNLKDYREYPYYYCVCTSTDRDEAENFEHQELIYSRVCTNIDYAEADYTEYNSAVEQANSLDRSLYKDLTALDEALSKDVSGLPSSMQSMVDEATQAILNAINALEYKDADYSAYNAAVEKANALDRSLYKDLTALDEALAVDVSGKNITEQYIVDSQTQAILEAINALEYKDADYSAYNAAVEKANALDRSLYKDLTALDEALAVDVSGKNITEQYIVDSQTQAILEAINALEYKDADYSAYNAAVEKANALDRSLYKDLTALDEALAVDVSSKNITEQDIVDFQTQAILETIDALEYKDAPTEPASTTEPHSETTTDTESTTEKVTESSNQNTETTTSYNVPDNEKSPRTGNEKIGSTVCCFTLLISSACLVYVLKRKD